MLKMKFTDGQTAFWAIEFQSFAPNIPFVPGNKYLIKGTTEKIEVRRGIMMLAANNLQFLTGKKEEIENVPPPPEPKYNNYYPNQQKNMYGN